MLQKEPSRSEGIPGLRRFPSCGHAGTPSPSPGPDGVTPQSVASERPEESLQVPIKDIQLAVRLVEH